VLDETSSPKAISNNQVLSDCSTEVIQIKDHSVDKVEVGVIDIIQTDVSLSLVVHQKVSV